VPFAIHHSQESDPGDRGRGLARAHGDAVANTVATYRRLFEQVAGYTRDDLLGFGTTIADGLTGPHPEIVEEISAIAEGCGLQPAELFAINARTELLGGHLAPECSLAAVVGERAKAGGGLLAQTWDWHPELAASRLIWTVSLPDGRSFATLTEAGILAKIGVNSDGVACGLNFLTSSLDGGVHGIPIHLLLRSVLQDCSSLTEALVLLLGATTSASSCITVADIDEDGEAFVAAVEVSPAGTRCSWPSPEGLLVHTNHFLAPPPGLDDVGARAWPGTLVRYQRLHRRLRAIARPLDRDDLEHVLVSHAGAPEPICRHRDTGDPWPDQRETLAAVLIDLQARTMAVTDGPPCSAAFETVARLVPSGSSQTSRLP
jgi:isopenicillin-N N-acyltransferase-like protein